MFPRAGESDVEIALREALANAIIHGNHREYSYKTRLCSLPQAAVKPDEVSITVKDEGRGFDTNMIADPTAPPKTSDPFMDAAST